VNDTEKTKKVLLKIKKYNISHSSHTGHGREKITITIKKGEVIKDNKLC
jgi:hypothetical protein